MQGHVCSKANTCEQSVLPLDVFDEKGTAENFKSNSDDSLGMLSNHLSIFHLNVQSLLPKIDLLRGEAEAYDNLVFSET